MAGLRAGVLISGRGSNLQALLDACADPAFPARIACVISNRPDAAGLERAGRAGVPAIAIDHRGRSRAEFEREVGTVLARHGVDFVCLAGFMRILTADFVLRWQGRIINIHPSLLPAFKGADAHGQAIAAGVRLSGCTVHYVVPEMDAGPIIAQAAVPVEAGDDAASLAERVLGAEHRLYPMVLRWIAEGRIALRDGRVEISGARTAGGMLVNPIEPT
ncbi:MAG: phosphoribosylglycinamide formyltransferase [Alphaproteobacteria bacterium]|nr:phosphoribosylglycinamide formyltransferase [Alphaproteobacteria bacterium]